MRRTAAALAATVAGLIALLSFKSHTTAGPTAADLPQAPAGAVQSATPGAGTLAGGSGKPSASASASAQVSTPGSGSTSASPSSRAGVSGSFTGTAAETIFGPVQVRATLTDGRITAVTVLQVPDRGGYEQQIVAYDVPRLTSEALAAQSAHIDTVSGATYTSEGYTQSLQSALDQAGL
jgi:uncharacterized protein with FMN-binding domain